MKKDLTNAKTFSREFECDTNKKQSNIPSLGEIKEYFKKMTHIEFKDQVKQLMEKKNEEDLHFFFYYIILFRELNNIRKYLNDETMPIQFLEKLFMFTYGHCTIYGYSTENIIDNVLSFFSNERLLKLLTESQFIKKDKFFRFYIMARFDLDTLTKYFSKQENIIDIISAFYKLPENMMKSIILRNHKLFEYVMMMLLVDNKLDNEAKLFIQKYKHIIDQFSSMNDIIIKYHTKVDLSKEEKLPFNKRNMKRISFLVNTIRAMTDQEMAVDYFAEENVFADDYERQVVIALVSDPLLKDTFQDFKISKTK